MVHTFHQILLIRITNGNIIEVARLGDTSGVSNSVIKDCKTGFFLIRFIYVDFSLGSWAPILVTWWSIIDVPHIGSILGGLRRSHTSCSWLQRCSCQTQG